MANEAEKTAEAAQIQPSPGSKFLIETLGCKANWFDSQKLENELINKGWRSTRDRSDPELRLCIVNSCTVTDEADRQSRKLASRLAAVAPNSHVVVTGCAAEVDPERLARSKGVSYVVGNQDKPKLVEMILTTLAKLPEKPPVELKDSETPEQISQDMNSGAVLGQVLNYSELLSRHPMDREWASAEEICFSDEDSLAQVLNRGIKTTKRTRAFIKIQEGCNSFCTYCIIPYGRGPSRSVGLETVIRQVDQLVSSGTKEVILTGTNLGDYGTDLGEPGTVGLENLVEEILTKTKLERLRVSSLDPTEITDALLTVASQFPAFCPHFHISLQHTETKILRLMKRKYTKEDISRCFERIERAGFSFSGPDAVYFGMDFITGFPGETLEDFEKSLESLKALPWTRLHVFPFSERAGTPATRLPHGVEMAERKRRAQILSQLSFDRQLRAAQHLKEASDQLKSILVEKHGDKWVGHTRNYWRCSFPQSAELTPNQLVDGRFLSFESDRAACEVGFQVEC